MVCVKQNFKESYKYSPLIWPNCVWRLNPKKDFDNLSTFWNSEFWIESRRGTNIFRSYLTLLHFFKQCPCFCPTLHKYEVESQSSGCPQMPIRVQHYSSRNSGSFSRTLFQSSPAISICLWASHNFFPGPCLPAICATLNLVQYFLTYTKGMLNVHGSSATFRNSGRQRLVGGNGQLSRQ